MPSITRRRLLQTLAGSMAALTGCQNDAGSGTIRRTSTEPSPSDVVTTSSAARTTASSTRPEPDAIGGAPALSPELAWPLPDRDPSNSSYLPTGPAFEQAPGVTWELTPLNPDESRYDPHIRAPTVADDTVYVVNAVTYGTNVVRPESQYLRAVSAAGETRWTRTLSTGDGTPIPSSPAIRGDVVLLGLDRTLRAYDRLTGDTTWTIDVDEGIHAILPTSNRIFIRANRAVVAVDTDETLWRVPYRVYPGAIAVGSDTVFVGLKQSLSALDPASGSVRWRQELPAGLDSREVTSLVAIAGGVLLRQASGRVSAYTETGAEVWHKYGLDTPVATDGTYMYATSAGSVRALRVTNGQSVWERRCDRIAACPGAVLDIAATDDSVIVAFAEGVLASLHAETGRVEWTISTPITVRGLALTDTGIYATGDVDDPMIKLTV